MYKANRLLGSFILATVMMLSVSFAMAHVDTDVPTEQVLQIELMTSHVAVDAPSFDLTGTNTAIAESPRQCIKTVEIPELTASVNTSPEVGWRSSIKV